MIHLATEMLLYLLCAALIGLVLGWLVWGYGRGGKMAALRAESASLFEAERKAHAKTRAALERAEAKASEAIEAKRTELQRTIDAERRDAEEARAALEKTRLEMEEAIRAEKQSATEAVDQALRSAEAQRSAASESKAKETQFLAEIEELRLLIGAEKLAAQSARAELARVRADMETALDAERAAGDQARGALDEIRSALARTFDQGASAALATSALGARSDEGEKAETPIGGGAAQSLVAKSDGEASSQTFDAPDDADIEDREDAELDLSAAIKRETSWDRREDDAQPAPTSPSTGRIALRPLPPADPTPTRPVLLLDRRPDEIDDLKAIKGIDAELERRLQDKGCYHYRQIAELNPADVDWLAQAIDLPKERIAEDRWIEQAKALRLESEEPARDDDASLPTAANDV